MADPERSRVAGTWFRHVPAGRTPFGRPPLAPDGRWQRGGVVEGLYLADSEATARAEWYRALSENNVPPREALPRDLWKMELDVEVVDLSTPERLGSWGLLPPAPDRRGWGRCQDVGERFHSAGWAGLVAPSAARPTGLVVCLFWRGPTMEGVRPLPPPDRWNEPPAPPRGMTT